jgi:hypothetical protein
MMIVPLWMPRSLLRGNSLRLAAELMRLWPRYRQYPFFVWLVLLQKLGLMEFPMD